MSRTLRIFFLAVCLMALATTVIAAQVTYVYRQSTGGRVDRIEISQEVLPDREVIGVSATSGETYRIESDGSGGVTVCRFEFPAERTAWIARRQEASLRLDGIVKGRAVSRTFSIDRNPWY